LGGRDGCQTDTARQQCGQRRVSKGTAMRKQKIDAIKKQLLIRREELLSEFRQKNAEAAELIDQGVPDVGDQSLTADLKDLLHLLSDSKREEILKIDEALDRIREGGFGFCTVCGKPIAIERLEIRPHTRHCIDCKKQLEKEQAEKAGPEKGLL
jgi:DnaK suppressor protein